MGDTKTYEGGCHCGKVKFQLSADLGTLTACNCSLCSMMGWRLTFVQGDHFKLLQGEDALTDYQFGKKHIHHPFCSVCGVRSFGHGNAKDGRAMVSVNVRCLHGVDAEAFPVRHFDGKSL